MLADKRLANLVACLITIMLTTRITIACATYAMWFVIFWLVYLFIRTKNRHLSYYMQGLFLLPKEIYAGIAIFYGSLLLSSFINLDMTGVKKTFDFFTWTIPLWLILITAGKYKIQKGIKYGIVIGTIFLCGVGLFQFYQGYVNGNAEIRIQANFWNANLLAMALEILFPLLAVFGLEGSSKVKKFLLLSIALFAFICMYMTQSRGALGGIVLAYTVTGVIYLYKIRNTIPKIKLKRICGLFCIGIFIMGTSLGALAMQRYNPNDHRFGEERGIMYESSLRMWEDNKLAGVGVANWNKAYNGKYQPEHYDDKGHFHPHNMFLNYLSTAGIIGEIGFISYVILLFVGGYRCVKQANNPLSMFLVFVPLLAYFFHGFLDDTLVHKEVARMFYLVLGIAVVYFRQGRQIQ